MLAVGELEEEGDDVPAAVHDDMAVVVSEVVVSEVVVSEVQW